MPRELTARVHVHAPEGEFVYGPGDSVPAKHSKLIVNPKAWANSDDDSNSEPVEGESE